jgi:hypothetical protein
MTRPNQVQWAPKEHPFCGNPDCVLYVRAGDPGVVGSGNWATLSDGRVIGRSLYGGILLCDSCGKEWLPVAITNLAAADRVEASL